MRLAIRLFSFGLIIILLASCGDEAESNSELFNSIFIKNDEGIFRGLTFGMSAKRIRKVETGLQFKEDELGLRTELDLGKGRKVDMDYFLEGESSTLSGIVVNMKLRDEFETVELYREIETEMKTRYGVAEGGFGDYTWKSAEIEAEVILKIDDAKTAILLNFIRPEL